VYPDYDYAFASAFACLLLLSYESQKRNNNKFKIERKKFAELLLRKFFPIFTNSVFESMRIHCWPQTENVF
jgi:hypothetical protein